ncbi:MAG: O-antigen polysaccharide polymerase Wzy family protein [Lachnospiraceae bacterium]|nr:O-antigen polysaccharide polymerase Wzy family protein [Lachnospiraceae bacterium]
MMKAKIAVGQVALWTFNLLLLCALIWNGVDLLMILIMETIVLLCSVCIQDINRRFFLFLFVMSFFIFLVSGDLASQLFGKKYWQQFTEEANRHAHICILLSLLGLLLGYFLGGRHPYARKGISKDVCEEEMQNTEFLGRLRINRNTHECAYIDNLRQWSKWVFIVTYLFLIVNTIDKIIQVRSNGYLSLYLGYSSLLGPLSQIGEFAPIALCAFLATFPNKKECAFPMIAFAVYAFAGLLVGQRGTLIYNMAFLVGYLFFRNATAEKHERWIKRWWIVAFCVAAPFALAALYLYGFIRNGQKIEFVSLSDSLVNFFVNIGSSSKVIKAGYDYSDRLTEFKFYSLGDVLNYFKYSRLFNWFGEIPAPHTKEFATQGHSFGEMISYVYMQKKYLNGEGAGSSFVACLYTDFGYIGVAAGSMLYGILFKSFENMDSKHWLSSSMKLYALTFLMKAPRGSFDCFLGGIINLFFVVVMLAIYLLGKYVRLGRPLTGRELHAGE